MWDPSVISRMVAIKLVYEMFKITGCKHPMTLVNDRAVLGYFLSY